MVPYTASPELELISVLAHGKVQTALLVQLVLKVLKVFKATPALQVRPGQLVQLVHKEFKETPALRVLPVQGEPLTPFSVRLREQVIMQLLGTLYQELVVVVLL